MPIARLRGPIEDRGDDWLIVSVGGVGVLTSVPATTAELFGVGAVATLYTHLHVREDALQLFGFATADDLRLFEQLISVSGVGPRVALGLLSAVEYGALATAIASGHTDVLRKVPGVGQKTAERIVLDLRDKVTPTTEVLTPAAARATSADAELVAALMGLGYTQSEASDAAARLDLNGDTPLEERIRRALSFFTSP